MDFATRLKALGVASVMLMASTSASATLIGSPFTSRALWDAAAPGTVVDIDFETPDASAAPGFIDATPLFPTGEGVDFTVGGDSSLFLISPTFDPALASQVLSSEGNTTGVQSLTITLPTPSLAFGVDYGSIATSAAMTITLDNGDVVSVPIASSPPFSFVGIIVDSATPFSTITLSAPIPAIDDALQIDDFAFTVPLVATSPTTVPLLGIGILVVFAAARRRNAASA